MDLYNGEIVAYRMARRPVFEMVSSMLEAALSRTNCVAGLILHSDQGWHYKMQPYRAILVQRGVEQSMSRKGNCFDNAAIESFFGTLKAEYSTSKGPIAFIRSKRACMITSSTTATSAHQAPAAVAQPGGIPIEKHRLINGTATVQLLGGSSTSG